MPWKPALLCGRTTTESTETMAVPAGVGEGRVLVVTVRGVLKDWRVRELETVGVEDMLKA